MEGAYKSVGTLRLVMMKPLAEELDTSSDEDLLLMYFIIFSVKEFVGIILIQRVECQPFGVVDTSSPLPYSTKMDEKGVSSWCTGV
jgi:hypothetical protein